MIPYLILLLIPSLFTLQNARRLSLSLWYLTFIIYWLFVGLRLEVGPDWMQYRAIHLSLSQFSVWELITQPEPLSYLLFWISESMGADVIFSNMVAAFILLVGVFCFARRTANPWLALVAATPYLIIVIGMTGVRQAMAAGVILFLLSRWENYSFMRRSAYILLAALFHTSALVNTIFLIVKLHIAMRYKLMLGVIVGAITLYLSFQVSIYADNMTLYQQRYLSGNEVRSIGSLYHIAMIAIPAFLGFIFRRRIAENIPSPPLLRFGIYAIIAILLINFVSPTVASRLTIYLYFVPMMVYSALAMTRDGRIKTEASMLVIGVHFLILAGWFEFANVSFAYLPYQNVLFDE